MRANERGSLQTAKSFPFIRVHFRLCLLRVLSTRRVAKGERGAAASARTRRVFATNFEPPPAVRGNIDPSQVIWLSQLRDAALWWHLPLGIRFAFSTFA